MSDPGVTDRSDPTGADAIGVVRESEARYRSVIAALAEGVSLYDREGRLVASNPMASRILGLGGEQFRERTLSDPAWRMIREDGSTWAAGDFPVLRTLRTGEPLWDQIMGVHRPDGTLRWISINTQPIFDAGGMGPSMAVASFIDVTDRKLAESKLRESEDRYRSLVENAPIGIGVHQGGRFVYANPRLASMLGVPGPEAMVGRKVMDFVHPDWREAVADRIRRITERGAVAPAIEERLVGLDGRVVDVEVVGSACTYLGAPGVQVAVLDVTGRKALEGQLLQSQKMEAVGRLASGVAHEFGNLLTAIKGYTGLAKRTLSASHPAVQALDRVQEAAEQAAGVTDSLLTFGRKSAGVKEPVRLMEPVGRAARLLRRTLPAAVELAVRGDEAVWVLADGNQVQQAVVNLAINARDAMRGAARGRLEIVVGPAPGEESMAQVRVADTGEGMTPGVQARLFEPFFTTKPSGEGTGLGLPIVRSIVEDHGGRVDVLSRAGEGTTITLLFPRISPPSDPALALASAGETRPRLLHGRTVLLAVAARHARELMAGALIDMGCTVVQAADGQALLHQRAALGLEARLLVVAADLPGRSGLECLDELRRGGDRTPAIVVCESSRACEGVAGRWTPLVQPFPMSELASMAARLMEEPRGVEEQQA